MVGKFSCASCNACMLVMLVKLGSRHFSARVREHLLSDRPSIVLDIYRVQSRAEHPAHGDTGLLRERPGLCSY